jgi:hypothetical protein
VLNIYIHDQARTGTFSFYVLLLLTRFNDNGLHRSDYQEYYQDGDMKVFVLLIRHSVIKTLGIRFIFSADCV